METSGTERSLLASSKNICHDTNSAVACACAGSNKWPRNVSHGTCSEPDSMRSVCGGGTKKRPGAKASLMHARMESPDIAGLFPILEKCDGMTCRFRSRG